MRRGHVAARSAGLSAASARCTSAAPQRPPVRHAQKIFRTGRLLFRDRLAEPLCQKMRFRAVSRCIDNAEQQAEIRWPQNRSVAADTLTWILSYFLSVLDL